MSDIPAKLILAIAALGLFATGAAADDADIAAMKRAWQTRQDKLITFDCKFEKKSRIPKGMYDLLFPDSRRKKPAPETDIELKSTMRVLMHGERMRAEKTGQDYSTEELKIKDYAVVSTFDGKNYVYFKSKSIVVDYQGAVIKKGSENQEYRDLAFSPIWMFARPADLMNRFLNIERSRLVRKDAPIGGRACWEFEFGTAAKHDLQKMWFDPARDFAVVRSARYFGSATTYQLDIQYEQNSGFWTPKAWSIAAREADNRALESVDCKLTGIAFNGPVADTEFDANLPPKTRVIDMSGEGEKQYVVRDNGKPGPEVDVAKGYPTYEQLSALAEKPEPRSNALMYAIGATALAAAAVGVVFVLRRRRKR